MARLFKPIARPAFEVQVWPYKDRIVGHCLCGRCLERFSITLHANPNAMPMILANEAFVNARVLNMANKHHSCDSDALAKDPAETNRIVNKWHEFKIKAKKAFGDTK